jgi:regulator of CtrA degradation
MSNPQPDEMSLSGMTMQSFAGTALFDRTFSEGMGLVEEAARYFEGRGRDEARTLTGQSAMLYSSESLRVTTRLMQAASWLLVQRAVQEGDMPGEDATNERYRLGSKEICFGGRAEDSLALPKTLQTLLARSDSLYRRIAYFEDTLLNVRKEPGVRAQFERLEHAFGA